MREKLGLPGGQRGDRRLDAIAQVEGPALQHDLAGNRAAHVEQVVHQARHVHHLALDDAGGAQGHGIRVSDDGQRVHGALDGAQGIAQFMRQHREEFILGAALALGARQRADVADDQRAMFDVVEHDAGERDLHLGGFMPIDHQPGDVAPGAMFEDGAQYFRLRRRQEFRHRQPEDLLQRAPHEVGEPLVAVHDVAVHRECGRAFLHALHQRAIGRVGAAQGEHAAFALFVRQQQRVDLAAVDGHEVVLGLREAGTELLDAEFVDVGANHGAAPVRPAGARDCSCRPPSAAWVPACT